MHDLQHFPAKPDNLTIDGPKEVYIGDKVKLYCVSGPSIPGWYSIQGPGIPGTGFKVQAFQVQYSSSRHPMYIILGPSILGKVV